MEPTDQDIRGTSCLRWWLQRRPALYILRLIQLIHLLPTAVPDMPISITCRGATLFTKMLLNWCGAIACCLRPSSWRLADVARDFDDKTELSKKNCSRSIFYNSGNLGVRQTFFVSRLNTWSMSFSGDMFENRGFPVIIVLSAVASKHCYEGVCVSRCATVVHVSYWTDSARFSWRVMRLQWAGLGNSLIGSLIATRSR